MNLFSNSLFCGLVIFANSSKAVVIAGDAVITSPGSFSDADLTLSQSIPSGEGLFSIGITQINAAQFRFDYQGIAEEYALFLVTAGLYLNPSYVVNTLPFVTNTGTVDPGVLTLGIGQSVLLGYWDDRTSEGDPDFGDNYGWLELSRTPTELVASNGYTAIGSGIIVGTATPIPEPSALILCLGAFTFVSRRQRPSSLAKAARSSQ